MLLEQSMKRDKIIKFLNKELQNMEEHQDRKSGVHRETMALLRSTQAALKEKELSDLQTKWEAKEELWKESRRQLEERLQKKEKTWQMEVSRLQEQAAEREQPVSRVEQERAALKHQHSQELSGELPKRARQKDDGGQTGAR